MQTNDNTEEFVRRGMVIVHRILEEQAAGCPVCGSSMTSEDCEDCGGEGYHELYEDDPLWYMPGDEEKCLICNGRGYHRFCLNAENHPLEES